MWKIKVSKNVHHNSDYWVGVFWFKQDKPKIAENIILRYGKYIEDLSQLPDIIKLAFEYFQEMINDPAFNIKERLRV